jgi:8-oxo-dGTP pyrophosphatase MutT (NUDIX family)
MKDRTMSSLNFDDFVISVPLVCQSCGNILGNGHKPGFPCSGQYTSVISIPISTDYESQTQPLALHDCAAILIRARSTGRYLIQQRGPNTPNRQGQWDITAVGRIEEGETPLDAALRELQEEMGATPPMFIIREVPWIRNEIAVRRSYCFLAECAQEFDAEPPDAGIVSDWRWMDDTDIREIREHQVTRAFIAEFDYLTGSP